ncbi:hypothetical protein Agub_g10195, partial [Astrephomene gubernaculifera]
MENYEYIADLGSGSYGFVWKCTQRSSGRTVAVKGFKLAHTDKRFLDQAIREVRMLRAACDHPNVVQLLEAFRSSSGRVYLVFEFVERCLSSELHKRFTCGLPAGQTRLVLWQLLAAVAHLHAKKIIHRDIKPGNLLLTAEGLVKLCDFGFARTTRADPHQADRFSSYVVTRWYRSPEMLVSDLYCAASDIWSLGCTFAELATGRPLFPGTSSLDQLWRIMRCLGPLPPSQAERFAAAAAAAGLPEPPPPPPRGKSLWQRLPELDSRLLDVVQACLRLDPTTRPTAVQLMQMPYFWEVPRLISASPLERHYLEYGGVGAFCQPQLQHTVSGRLRSYISRSGLAGAASLSSPFTSAAAPTTARGSGGAAAGAAEDMLLSPQSSANGPTVMAAVGLTGDASGGGGGDLSSRQPPRPPSVLLSAVAASLIGEHPQSGSGAGGGSVPLVAPLPPQAPTTQPQAQAQQPQPRPQPPASQPQPHPQSRPLPQTQVQGSAGASGAGVDNASGAAAAAAAAAAPGRNPSPQHVISPTAPASASVATAAGLGKSSSSSATTGVAAASGGSSGAPALVRTPSPAPPSGLPRAHSHSRFMTLAAQHPPPQQQQQRTSSSRSPSPPVQRQPSQVPALPALPAAPHQQQQQQPQPPAQQQLLPQRRATANIMATAAALTAAPTAATALRDLSYNRTQSAREASEPVPAAAEQAPAAAAAAAAQTRRSAVAFGEEAAAARTSQPTPSPDVRPDTPQDMEPDDATIAAGLLSDGDGDSGAGVSGASVGGAGLSRQRNASSSSPEGGPGLGPGVALLAEEIGREGSDVEEGHISDDDELMQYFAARAPAAAAAAGPTASRRAATSRSAMLESADIERRGASVSVVATSGGGAAAAAAVAATVSLRSGSSLGVMTGNNANVAVPSPLGGRRAPSDVRLAGSAHVAHRSLYGSRQNSSSGLAAMLPGARRVAAMVLGGLENGGGTIGTAGSVAAAGGSGAVAAAGGSIVLSPTQQQRKRVTVGSYLATSESLSVTVTAAASPMDTPLPAAAAPSARAATTTSLGAEVGGGSSRFASPRCLAAVDSHTSLHHATTPTGLPALNHHSTVTGMTTTSSSISLALPVPRASLPVHSYHATAGGPSAIGYCTMGGVGVGGVSSSCRRAVSRQGSTVFNQLMYDALPEIGTPGGAPEVPSATPPKRRAVMSGFTPCRTAVARAAANGVPPAAAMAAAMGEVLRSTPADLNVAYSPIQVNRPEELLSPEDREHGLRYPEHMQGTASASAATISAACAAVSRRVPYATSHRRPVLSLPYTSEAGNGMPPYRCPSGGPGNHQHAAATGAAAAAGANSPNYSRGPAYNNTHYPCPHGAATTTSDTGMLLGSSAPCVYRQPHHRVTETSGAVPIPGCAAGGHGPCAGGMSGPVVTSTGGGTSASPGVGLMTSIPSRGYPHPLTPAGRSRLASGTVGHLSDLSVSNPRENLQQLAAGVEDAPSVDLDTLGPWGGGVGMSPGGPGASGVPPPMHVQSMPLLNQQGASFNSAGGYCNNSHSGSGVYHQQQQQQQMVPQQQQQGLPPVGGARAGRVGRWVSALIDSLPEDREVFLEGQEVPGGGGGGGAVGGGTCATTANDGTIQ